MGRADPTALAGQVAARGAQAGPITRAVPARARAGQVDPMGRAGWGGPGGPDHPGGPGGPGGSGGGPWDAPPPPPPNLAWRGIDQGRFDHQPFNYNGHWVTPFFNPQFNNWGFWLFGIWIPL